MSAVFRGVALVILAVASPGESAPPPELEALLDGVEAAYRALEQYEVRWTSGTGPERGWAVVDRMKRARILMDDNLRKVTHYVTPGRHIAYDAFYNEYTDDDQVNWAHMVTPAHWLTRIPGELLDMHLGNPESLKRSSGSVPCKLLELRSSDPAIRSEMKLWIDESTGMVLRLHYGRFNMKWKYDFDWIRLQGPVDDQEFDFLPPKKARQVETLKPFRTFARHFPWLRP